MTTDSRSKTEDATHPPDVPGAVAACCGVALDAPGAGEWSCSPAAMMAGFQARVGAEGTPGCPMARMWQGTTRGGARALGWLVPLAALALVTLGVAILVAPQVLIWLVAGGLICAGVAVLVAAARLRARPTRAD